jgi:dTDP-4-dehydrorhamnose reductase
MRILVLGRTGQVGRELSRVGWPREHHLIQIGREACDLADVGVVRRTVRENAPDIVINAAAYTAVDRAESEPELAGRINRDAPAAMAEVCEAIGAALIQLSTDYVFDGSKSGAYSEDDPVAPLSVYGRTKAEGETAIRNAAKAHVIVRTSWIFAAHGTNFVRSMLRLASEGAELRIVGDQRGAPTAARDVADAIGSIVKSLAKGDSVWGTYHFTSGEPTTWYDFARAIVDLSGQQAKVVPITTSEFGPAARRPSNSILDCGRILRHFGIAQPSWRQALVKVLADMQQTVRASNGPVA